jgi:hypothetical protein
MVLRVVPFEMTRLTRGMETKSSAISSGLTEETRTSRSPMVSFLRRADPAGSTLRTASDLDMWEMIWSMTGRIPPRRKRSCLIRWASMLFRMFSSVFGPNPFRTRSFPALTASSRPSMETTPSSSWSLSAVFGPTPSSSIRSRTPWGRASLRSSSWLLSPVLRTSSMTAAMLLPTPGISTSSFLSWIRRMSSVSDDTL